MACISYNRAMCIIPQIKRKSNNITYFLSVSSYYIYQNIPYPVFTLTNTAAHSSFRRFRRGAMNSLPLNQS